MKILWANVVAVLAIAVGGCASNIAVIKALPDTAGLHYYLPQPFIQVTPYPDGTIVVEVIYLPDPKNEYAIQASSYFGQYTLDVNRTEKGFLETVSFNADSTGVAKQLIQSGANLRAADIEAKAAKATAEAADAKAASDKLTAAIATADKARTDAQIAVDVAQQKYDLLGVARRQSSARATFNDQIVAARLALAEATVKRDAAQAAYNAAITSPGAANAKTAARPVTPDAAFYRIAMSADSVELKRDFNQKDRETWVIPKTNAGPADLVVLPSALVVRPEEKSQALTGTVKSDRELRNVVVSHVYPPLGGTKQTVLLSRRFDKQTVDIEFPKDTAAGEYTIDLLFTSGSKDKPTDDKRSIIVRIER